MADILKHASSNETTARSQKSSERSQPWPVIDTRRGVSSWPFSGRYDDYGASPFGLLRRMSDEMDRWSSSYSSGANERAGWSPSVEVFERDGNLIVHADLPGVSKDDMRIQVANNNLIIEGER